MSLMSGGVDDLSGVPPPPLLLLLVIPLIYLFIYLFHFFVIRWEITQHFCQGAAC